MKNYLFLFLFLPAFALAQSTQLAGYPEEYMRKEVNPGENFMQYATGGWLESHPLQDDQLYNGSFRICQDSVAARMSRILIDLLVRPQEPGSVGEFLSIFYKQYSDTAQRNTLGVEPMMPDLQSIREAHNKQELQREMSRLWCRGGETLLFSWGIRADYEHADSTIVAINAYELPINPTYYILPVKEEKEVREAYKLFGSRLFAAAGYDSLTAREHMEKVYTIEKKLSHARYVPLWKFWKLFKNRDLAHSVHKMSISELKRKYKEIYWDYVFETYEGILDVHQVDVSSPEALELACEVLRTAELEDLKCLVEFRLLYANWPLLTQNLRRDYLAFQRVLKGVENDQPQWRVNADFMSENLSRPMGQLYCERYFPKEYKVRIQSIVDNLCKAFRIRLLENTWMSDQAKHEALRKLDNITWQVAFPDVWDSYEGLQISQNNSLYENYARYRAFRTSQILHRDLNSPVDRSRWRTNAQEVNAFNIWGQNCVCIPAGILQGNFFDPEADEAINYGAIGTVIGHELTHGYDPVGCQLDSIGNVRMWWTKKDKRAYEKRTKVLRKYFGGLWSSGLKVNGRRTLGENVADNGGIHIAFDAMNLAGIDAVIDGQTAAQRFFLGYARTHSRILREKYLKYLNKNDTHAPSEARINGALPQIDAWYDAFDIRSNDYLYVAPSKRASIW